MDDEHSGENVVAESDLAEIKQLLRDMPDKFAFRLSQLPAAAAPNPAAMPPDVKTPKAQKPSISSTGPAMVTELFGLGVAKKLYPELVPTPKQLPIAQPAQFSQSPVSVSQSTPAAAPFGGYVTASTAPAQMPTQAPVIAAPPAPPTAARPFYPNASVPPASFSPAASMPVPQQSPLMGNTPGRRDDTGPSSLDFAPVVRELKTIIQKLDALKDTMEEERDNGKDSASEEKTEKVSMWQSGPPEKSDRPPMSQHARPPGILRPSLVHP